MTTELTSNELTYEATSRFLDTEKGRLHYHEAGEGDPVLLLHGGGPGATGWANFRDNLPVFAEHFRTIVWDAPGFGQSYAPDMSPVVAGHDAVQDLLAGLEIDKIALVGNSMGGAIATRLASEVPDRVSRLVTMGGMGFPLFSPSPPEGIKLLMQYVADPSFERLVAFMESMVFDTTILTDDLKQLRWEAANAPGAIENMRKLFNPAMGGGGGNAADRIGALTRITAPTLVTIGRDDRVSPPDGVLVPMRLIPKCEIHTFYDCGHWAMIERKEQFESVVLAFLLRND